jgi:hypothetical protein
VGRKEIDKGLVGQGNALEKTQRRKINVEQSN